MTGTRFPVTIWLAILLLAVADRSVHAQTGFYVHGGLGVAGLSDIDADFVDNAGQAQTTTLDLDTGLSFGLAAGWLVGDVLRPELQVRFQGRDFDATDTSPGGIDLTGRVSTTTLMTNVWLELNSVLGFDRSSFHPYAGGGLGLSWNDIDDIEVVPGNDRLGGDGSSNFAWQMGVGFGYGITDHLVLDVGYRYLDLGDVESGVNADSGNDFGRPVSGSLSMHEALIGLRFHF